MSRINNLNGRLTALEKEFVELLKTELKATLHQQSSGLGGYLLWRNWRAKGIRQGRKPDTENTVQLQKLEDQITQLRQKLKIGDVGSPVQLLRELSNEWDTAKDWYDGKGMHLVRELLERLEKSAT